MAEKRTEHENRPVFGSVKDEPVDFGRARTGGAMLETAVRLLRDEIGTAATVDKLEVAARVLRLEQDR